MAGIDRRKFIKNVAIGGAVLGLGSAVLNQPSPAMASGLPAKEKRMSEDIKPEVIASCHCKKVVLKLVKLDTRFTVCHCDTCQLLHNGPWYGADCADIQVIDGRQYVTEFPVEHGQGNKKGTMPKGWTAWHFCSNCGSRLFYALGDKVPSTASDRYNVSVGLLYPLIPKDMLMENEVFFDMKPDYYSFHETKKFSSGQMIQSLKMATGPAGNKGV
ncbi:MAG: twin-arginine translocation signal domain-containing protein [Desulfarculaceae bacterium]|nr:twin-arginine translocation signal domain-containing protein [Desulfarculaceae bacterium]